MPSFNEYEQSGRTLMVKFTCQRCYRHKIVHLEAVDKGLKNYGNLHDLKIPYWKDLLGIGPLLCPECAEAYEKFMQHEEEAEK